MLVGGTVISFQHVVLGTESTPFILGVEYYEIGEPLRCYTSVWPVCQPDSWLHLYSAVNADVNMWIP